MSVSLLCFHFNSSSSDFRSSIACPIAISRSFPGARCCVPIGCLRRRCGSWAEAPRTRCAAASRLRRASRMWTTYWHAIPHRIDRPQSRAVRHLLRNRPRRLWGGGGPQAPLGDARLAERLKLLRRLCLLDDVPGRCCRPAMGKDAGCLLAHLMRGKSGRC